MKIYCPKRNNLCCDLTSDHREGSYFPPKINGPAIHGGGFCIGSPFTSAFRFFLSMSLLYLSTTGLSPEHQLPIAYDDSWAGLQWIAKHSNGNGPETWINEYTDLGRVILAGESAGGTTAHYVAVQAGTAVAIKRLMIVHPYYCAKEPDKLCQYKCPIFKLKY
ncbi:2-HYDROXYISOFLAVANONE DEHYDRATASE-LIKE [Salix purpurea]|uniref:2-HYDROXYISOFLAVANONE DEHYDRATASE-LIKE n=1 Tax=Salix purpurea TaxID=77065 RepID=A0A9Q0USB6_SALPP|nr:2-HYDROXYISOFLAVANONE DEHYDRATASE-LIKE [Salix purpurea]